MRISGTDLYIPKGDTTELNLTFAKNYPNHKFYMFLGGSLVFNVNTLVPKGEGEDAYYEATFEISSSFTDEVGKKHYDIIMIENTTNKIKTIIRKGLFIIEPSIASLSKEEGDLMGKNPEEEQ